MFQIIRKSDINHVPFHIIWNEDMHLNSERFKAVVEVCRKILSVGLKGLDAIILFGSVARGEEDRRSDTDLLLIFESEESALKAEDETAKISAENKELKLSIVNKSYKELSSDPYFAFEVIRDGIVLYKKPSLLALKSQVLPARPYYIYIFDFKGFGQHEKSRISTALYGRRKGKHEYRGLIDAVGGFKLGRGAILVPASAFRQVETFFETNKVKYKRLAISYLYGELK